MARSTEHYGGSAGLVAATALLLVVGYLVMVRYVPPDPQSATANPRTFSALRALPILEDLTGDGIPHPVGSAHHDVVRDRIVRHFESFGYTPEIQRATIETRSGPREISNIIARIRGMIPGEAVVLVSHYDSVTEGPGASDAGVCVATILEIARMLNQDTPPLNDIIFLVTDAEEYGLLGARLFVEEYDLPRDAVVINLEARGTSGPSIMFETSDESGWLIDIFAAVVEQPVTNSLFYEIYRRMPNDTDFTIFKRNGFEGLNFAFIGEGENYHTSRDDFGNVTLSSFQHHGDNALALLRMLGWSDLSDRESGRHVYFDLLGLTVVKWPEIQTLRYALFGVLLLLLALLKLHREEMIDPSGVLAACVLWIILLAGGILLGWGLDRLLVQLGVITSQWMDGAIYIIFAFWLLPLFWAFLVVPRLGQKMGITSIWEMWLGTWLWWTILSLLCGIIAPGVSYLFLAPALAASAIGALAAILLVHRTGLGGYVTAVISAVFAAAIWLPIEFILYDALGFSANILLAVKATMVMLLLTPLMIRVQPWQKARR
ncbi:M28 family peptidase [Gemmatimonadota bacterium]